MIKDKPRKKGTRKNLVKLKIIDLRNVNVGYPTSTKNETNSQYISGVKTSPY